MNKETREILSNSWYGCGYREVGDKGRAKMGEFLEDNKDFIQALYKPSQIIREALNRLGVPTTHYHKETENEEREQTIKDVTEILKKALTKSRQHLDKNKIIEILVKLPLIIPVTDKNMIAKAIVKEL